MKKFVLIAAISLLALGCQPESGAPQSIEPTTTPPGDSTSPGATTTTPVETQTPPA